MIAAGIFVVFPLCLALAAWTDLFTMTIPNRIPLILIGAFVLIAPFAGLGPQDLMMHLLAGVAMFAACFILFAMNTMGGGDAKLLTAAALWFGFNMSLFTFAVYVSLFGGVVTLAIMALRAHSETVALTGLSLPGSLTTEKKIPYGIAIAIAGFVAYPESPLVQAALESITRLA